jgi:AraC-like DNA-binding protein
MAGGNGCFTEAALRFFSRRGICNQTCLLNNQGHLSLRQTRLRPPEELDQQGEGITFLFSKGGVGKFTSPKAAHRLLPGDVLIFNGAVGGKLGVFENKGEFHYGTFSVCFENLLPLFAGSEISLLQHITEGFKAAKIYPASSPLAADCQRLLGLVPAQFDLDHRGQLIRIAASILAVEFKEAQSKRSGYARPEDHMIQAFDKLSASELISLSVGELASRFNCSRRHLNRLFHQHFGVSVAALRMEMRLLKAVSLLRDASAKIINVAEQCGFNHLGLFNTCFKRRFGASPGQWRKSALHVESLSARKLENKTSCPMCGGELLTGGQPASPSPAVMAAFATKITDGASILEDLKHRNLAFEAKSSNNIKQNKSKARGHE